MSIESIHKTFFFKIKKNVIMKINIIYGDNYIDEAKRFRFHY